MRPTALLLLLTTLTVLSPAFRRPDSETIRIKPFMDNFSLCLECHNREATELMLKNRAVICNDACLKCHENMENHHPVGMEIEFDLPPAFHVSREKKLQCVSCHDLTAPRFDVRPWRSESLFGKLFRSSSQYKTYFLIQNNHDGQLCKNCH